MSPPFGSVGLIGLGLIGSSIARAIRSFMPECRTAGYTEPHEIRERIRELNLVDTLCDTPQQAVENAELVILCTPIRACRQVATQIADNLSKNTIVTDTGSTKRSVSEVLFSVLSSRAIVIPGHPVAGTEHSGPEAGMAQLFQERYCVLTPFPDTPPEALEKLTQFWTELGSHVQIMDSRQHDALLALTSHLPHFVAYALVETVRSLETDKSARYSAGGFRDFTRIAASDPQAWRDIFLDNREFLLDRIDQFSKAVEQLREIIARQDGRQLQEWCARAGSVREAILQEHQAGQFIATESKNRKLDNA